MLGIGIGIGIGSTATKIAVLDESGAVADVDVRPTGFSSVEATSAAGEHLASQGFLDGPHAVVATGYSRIAVPFADKMATEITCHELPAVARRTAPLARTRQRPRHYSPGSEATSPIFSRLSTKSAINAADWSHTKTRSRLSMATSFTMPALTSWRIASFVAP